MQNMGLYVAFIDINKEFDTDGREGLVTYICHDWVFLNSS